MHDGILKRPKVIEYFSHHHSWYEDCGFTYGKDGRVNLTGDHLRSWESLRGGPELGE